MMPPEFTSGKETNMEALNKNTWLIADVAVKGWESFPEWETLNWDMKGE